MSTIVDFIRAHTLEVIWTALISVASIAVTTAAIFAWRAVDNYIALRASSEFSSRLRVIGPVSRQINANSWVASCDRGEIVIGGFCQVNNLDPARNMLYVLHNAGMHPVQPYNEFACSYGIGGGTPEPQDVSVWAHCYKR